MFEHLYLDIATDHPVVRKWKFVRPSRGRGLPSDSSDPDNLQMANRPVNDAQLEVLRWLAAGGSQDPPEPSMKQRAAALQSRGLAKVQRSGGQWTAQLTEAGQHYVKHGRYPHHVARTHLARTAPPTTKPSVVAPGAPGPTPRPPKPRAVPLREQIRRPHPAVKEIVDRPARLPKFAVRRCQLILHTLVSEALARGWTVTPIPAKTGTRSWDGGTHTYYDMQSLLLIDAGHSPVGLRLEEVQRQVPHEDTKEEAARRAKGQYIYAPNFDLLATGKLRLHLLFGDRKQSSPIADTVTMLVEDKLDRVLERIEEATQSAIEFAERRRCSEEEYQRRREEQARIQALREQYEEWEGALVKLSSAWREHEAQREFLAALADATPEGSEAFVSWAREHLMATDPRPQVPEGTPPARTHEDRVRVGRLKKHERMDSIFGWPPPDYR